MKFLKYFFAALLAVVVGGLLSWIFLFVALVGLSASSMSGTQATITPNTIVKIDLAENITDSPSLDPMAGFNFASMSMTSSLNLLKVLQNIEAAEADSRVKGIYLNITGMGFIDNGGLEELRSALLQFKKTGKFIVAYNENYSQAIYYLASVADKIYIQKEGGFSLTGLSTTSLFFKGALDNLGLSAEIFRPTSCKYKSAVEPYILKEMSPENRAQMQMMVDDMWGVIAGSIAESRNIELKKLNSLADNLDILFPEDALKHGLVDGVIYENEMEEVFSELGVERGADGEFNIISLGEYVSLSTVIPKFGVPAVGIVYAEGEVRDGEGEDNNIYSVNLSNTLRKARKDDNIKAVVLRVNSPGGSALASDVIWKEVELLRAKKPVIVSMGAYAASGGYYISAPADAIVADRLTLTGSIGVFGMRLEGGNLLNKKIGISTDVVKSNKFADFGGGSVMGLATRKLNATERKAMLRSVDKVYESFTEKVSTGRNLPMEKVLDISQGRVWSGVRAVELGLADLNGGLKEAISIAADKGGIADNFSIVEVLGDLTPLQEMMLQMGSQLKSVLLDNETLELVELHNSLKEVLRYEGVQALCPYRVELN